MQPDSGTSPPLSTRFLAPEGWRWHNIRNAQGKTLRFGTASPAHRPRAIVVVLPGLSEFCEKYFETAHDLLARECAVWILDWRGQGRSDRFFPDDPERRHSEDFAEDLSDLDLWIRHYVRPASGGVPLILLGHSMGGHMGLRWLAGNPGLLHAAAFTAPLVGIRVLRHLPRWLARTLTHLFDKGVGTRYAPGGGRWREGSTLAKARLLLTSDPERGAVHEAWYVHDPALRTGGVTFGWLRAAHRSCLALQAPGIPERIGIPCLLAIAGQEGLVDNLAIRELAARMPRTRILELPQARHEILMERDACRSTFFEAFDRLLTDSLANGKQEFP